MSELIHLSPSRRGRETRQLAREILARRSGQGVEGAAMPPRVPVTASEDESEVTHLPTRTVPDSVIYERRWGWWRAKLTTNSAMKRILEAK